MITVVVRASCRITTKQPCIYCHKTLYPEKVRRYVCAFAWHEKKVLLGFICHVCSYDIVPWVYTYNIPYNYAWQMAKSFLERLNISQNYELMLGKLNQNTQLMVKIITNRQCVGCYYQRKTVVQEGTFCDKCKQAYCSRTCRVKDAKHHKRFLCGREFFI